MYRYTEGGLTNVWLSNGFREEDTPYGKGVSIEDVESLHCVIGMKLVKERAQLTGAEFRFLRKELGLSQAKLAHWWGYEAQSVAGWEKRGRVRALLTGLFGCSSSRRFPAIRPYWRLSSAWPTLIGRMRPS